MKDKLKPLIKEAKKTAQKNIEQTLVVQLKEITLKFGEGSKKLDKKIAKEAKKLSKKLAKDIKIAKTLLTNSPKQLPPAESANTVAPAKAKTVTSPAAKKPAAKVSAS